MLLDETIDGMRAKAPPSHRIVAKIIDFSFALLITRFDSIIAVILAGLYLLTADTYGLGQSMGKKLMRLRTIHPETGWPCHLKGTVLRNSILVAPFIGLHFGLVFAILSVIGGLFIAIYEVQLLFRDPYGVRIGDILGGTEVIKIEATATAPNVQVPLPKN